MNKISICGSPPIFLDNKYTACYLRLMASVKNRIITGYTEKHHIWPCSLDGPRKTPHLAKLTGREHFIAHHLLTKMTEGLHKRSMCYALSWFTADKDGKRKLTARQYEIARKALVVYLKFYLLDGDEYSLQSNLYDYCDTHKVGRGNVQGKMKNGMHVILAGNNKGKCFSPLDVGAEAMKAYRELALKATANKRIAAVTKAWKDPNRQQPEQDIKIEVISPTGKLYSFNTLMEAAIIGPPPTLQNRKTSVPYTFTNDGPWTGWTLQKYVILER